MGRAFGFVTLIIVVAAGAYIYMRQTQSAMTAGTNSPTALSVRLPVTWREDSVAVMDTKDSLPMTFERTGQDVVAVLTVPSGTHRIELFRVPRGREAF